MPQYLWWLHPQNHPCPCAHSHHASTGPTTGSNHLGSGDGMHVKEGNTRQRRAEKGEGGRGPFSAPSPLGFILTVSSLMCNTPYPGFTS